MAPGFELNFIDAVAFGEFGDFVCGIDFVHRSLRSEEIIRDGPQLPIAIVLDPFGRPRPLQLTILFRVTGNLSCRVDLFLRSHVSTPNYHG